MASERWFPARYELPDGSVLGNLAWSGADWQIFKKTPRDSVLVAKSGLADRWISRGLVAQEGFQQFTYGSERYAFRLCGEGFQLAPVGEWTSADTKVDALSFAVSVRETRKIDADSSLHDGIYVERLSRILPTWTLTPRATDAEVLGTWLAGGVQVPANAFRRLKSIMSWLGEDHLREVIHASGLSLQRPRPPRDPSATRESSDVPRPLEAEPPCPDVAGKAAPSDAPAEASQFMLHGRPRLAAFFNEHVVDIVANAERYKALGIDFPSAIVLHGPPGCGKTFAVERLVEHLDWPIYYIDSQSVGSPYIHETSKKIAGVFDKAMETAPSVIVIDEMESYLSDRQSGGTTGLHHVEEVAEFLRRVPVANRRRVLIFGMTNRLEMIDDAILRRGRFDHVVEVGMPTLEEVRELLTHLTTSIPRDDDFDLEVAAVALAGRPLSDAAFLIRETARLAARSGKTALDRPSLDKAIAGLPEGPDGQDRPIGFR